MFGIKVLEERKSKYNGDLRVVKSWGMGTYIQSDGLTQSGGVVETIWKQTIRRVKNPKLKVQSCLILGLGGGTVAKLIHKNWPTTSITCVDIDPMIVELGIKYLNLNESIVKIKIQDALELSKKLKVKSEKFDLIVVDLYQGDIFPEKFNSDVFLKIIPRLLTKNGIAVFNRLYLKNKKVESDVFGQKLEKVFKKVIKFYPQANLMFVCSN